MHDLPPIDPHSYKPLREQIYDILREGILTGRLVPGEQVTEVGISEQFRVSRTPTREAIRMLEQEGFLVIIPRKGAFVSGIKSRKEITDIFQVRIVLEGLAASLAAQHITKEQIAKLKEQTESIAQCIAASDVARCIEIDTAFHRLICEASHNELLQRILDNLFEQITRFRAASLAGGGRLQQALEDHRRLFAAIADGDSALAKQLAEQHLDGAQARVLEVFRQQQVK